MTTGCQNNQKTKTKKQNMINMLIILTDVAVYHGNLWVSRMCEK